MARSLNYNRQIVLIANNLRSTHNVGSLFRTAEGLGVSQLILTGYTAYPKTENDPRLAHIADKLDNQIAKTALGAQDSLNWRHSDDLSSEIGSLSSLGFIIYGLEQTSTSIRISDLKPPTKVAIIVGNEVSGLDDESLRLCDQLVEIPMFGNKESFNVVQAAAMALFYLRFY